MADGTGGVYGVRDGGGVGGEEVGDLEGGDLRRHVWTWMLRMRCWEVGWEVDVRNYSIVWVLFLTSTISAAVGKETLVEGRVSRNVKRNIT